MADDWRTPDTDALIDAVLRLEDADEAGRFLRDLCTLGELRDLGAALGGRPAARPGQALRRDLARDRRQHGDDHPDRLVAQPRRGRLPPDARAPGGRPERRRCPSTAMGAAMRERLRLAVPNKGRMVEPTRRCSTTRGWCSRSTTAAWWRASEPSRSTSCSCARTTIEFVGDGVADLGITGGDLLPRRASSCRWCASWATAAAGSRPPCPTTAPFESIADLAACASPRPPQHHPAVLRGQGIAVDVVTISGAVEVAPKLGLADAIVDLVSTGSTLAMNGLRPIGEILAPEAVVVANPTAQPRSARDELDAIVTMLGAVIAARGRKYLMMNAPATHLAELEDILPGLESPSVIPLAHEGMVAIHAVVGADEVWAPAAAEGGRRVRASSWCRSRRSCRDRRRRRGADVPAPRSAACPIRRTTAERDALFRRGGSIFLG